MTSPNWKRPEEVMKFHRLKQKKRALSARMNGNDHLSGMSFSNSSNSEDSFIEMPQAKRRNVLFPRTDPWKEPMSDESGLETDFSSDSTLFHILSNSVGQNNVKETPRTFENILQHLNRNEQQQTVSSVADKVSIPRLPVDWSLKSKVRFMSSRPFVWSSSLRTCEEASGISGFTRCLDMSSSSDKTQNIDTSPNAKFHQCCLYWQHPSLPWLNMFPRNSNNKVSSHLITTQLDISSQLFQNWTVAFKSLFQLVRARQCPFFYVLANQFCCLFRAAGVCGEAETHALITPTTLGLRKMLDDEGVEYSMPLQRKRRSQDLSGLENTQDSGVAGADDEEEDDEEWMQSIGVNSKDMKRLTASQKALDRKREGQVDGSYQSLVVTKGVDVQALFNLLVNCKSCVSLSGPLAGVPPTLLSPVAFQLATLQPCTVKDSAIRVDGTEFHSIQVEGPILPNSLRQMCHLLDDDGFQYSASVATVKQSVGFTMLSQQKPQQSETNHAGVFLKENLSDCGLSKSMLNVFCDADHTKYGVIDNIEPLPDNS